MADAKKHNSKKVFLGADDSSYRFVIANLMSDATALGRSLILVRLSELEPTATAFHRVFEFCLFYYS